MLGFRAKGNPLEFIRFLGKASLSLLGSGQGKLEFFRLSLGISMIFIGFRVWGFRAKHSILPTGLLADCGLVILPNNPLEGPLLI